MFSVIIPCEDNRINLLVNTLEMYNAEADIEVIIVSRSITSDEFIIHPPNVTIKIVNYKWEGKYFNPSMAFNLGVKHSTYDNIIITCPEVIPLTNVFEQLLALPKGNYVCQVFDQESNGKTGMSLVNTAFRSKSPAMYFFALFQKKDIENINGWDLAYMNGIAYEDDDFGDRFNKSGAKFEMRDEIQLLHQYHPRNEMNEGWQINKLLYEYRSRTNNFYCKKGLKETI